LCIKLLAKAEFRILPRQETKSDLSWREATVSAPPNDAAHERQVILHYQVEQRLGAGGMGVVFKALDLRLKRHVALKFLAAGLHRDEAHRERLLREAMAASALDHPNIGAVHALEDAGDGRLFIVMGYYPGGTLKDRLEHGPLGNAEAVDIALQAARGLAEAHARGIMHRDIKPTNLILTPEGVVKIVDFGIAKLTGASDLTETGTALGTAAYMSPEQASGARVDWRTDMWSLGIVLYQMLRGEMPFHGETFLALLYQVVHADYPPLTGKPPALQRLIGKCLAKDPSDRYASPEELMKELERVQKSIAAGDTAETVAFPQESPPSTPAFTSLDSARFSPRLLALLATVCLGGAVWLWMGFRTPPASRSTAGPNTTKAREAVRPVPPETPQAKTATSQDPSPPTKQTSQPRVARQTATAGRGTTASVYTGPKQGQILWTGELDAGQAIDLSASQNAAMVSGSLPGVPVSIEVHPPSVSIVTPPGPSNQWRRLVVRNDGKKQVVIVINWAITSP
jgi:serine/threonine protein kinase